MLSVCGGAVSRMALFVEMAAWAEEAATPMVGRRSVFDVHSDCRKCDFSLRLWRRRLSFRSETPAIVLIYCRRRTADIFRIALFVCFIFYIFSHSHNV